MSDLLLAVAMLTAFAGDLRIPPAMAVGIGQGEARLSFDPDGNDGGVSAGLLQVHLPTHGGPASRWTGASGAQASIELMRSRWATAARGAPSPYEWSEMTWQQRVTAFSLFWIAAQGADAAAVNRRAADVLVETEAILAEIAGDEGADVVKAPTLTWVSADSSNFRDGRNGVSPEALVVHTMVGTLAGCDSWFKTPAPQRKDSQGNPAPWPSSAHFGVGRDGTIHQYVSTQHAAIANGAEAGIRPWVMLENPGIDANDLTISIEHDDGGKPGSNLPTPAQFEASAQLAAWLWQSVIVPGGASNLAIDRNHITRHADFAPASRAGCPGWPESMLSDYIARVAALVAGVVGPPPVEDYRSAWIAELWGIIAAAADDDTLADTIKLRASVRSADARRKLAALGVEA